MALIKCSDCGKEISDKATTCINCGCPIEKECVKQSKPNFRDSMAALSKIYCPKCRSDNVIVQMVQESGKTGTKGAGALWNPARAAMMVGTMGLWGIVGKRKSTSKTKIKSSKIAICQDCGKSWKV